MSTENAPRDQNDVPALMGTDMTTGRLTTNVYVDEATHRLLVNATISGSSGGGAILDGVSSAIKATVFNFTNSKPLAVVLRDTNGDYVSVGGGTQYAELSTTNPGTGTLAMGRYLTSLPTLTNAQMSTPMLDSSGRLLVNIAAGSASGTQYADGAARGTATGTLMMVDDGTLVQSALGDSSGRLFINTAQINGVTPLMGSGIMGTGSARVTIASDNDPLTVKQATGTNLHTVVDSGTLTAVTAISNALPAGNNLLGKVGIDQTTPGTTNKVAVSDSLGNSMNSSGPGFLRVTDEPKQVFYDSFDATPDTTNMWTSTTGSSGVAAAVATGVLSMGTGTVANGYSKLTSIPTFKPVIPGWIVFSDAIQIPDAAAPTANALRLWGAGTTPVTPTKTAPITDGYFFELDGSVLSAVVYAGGTRTQIATSLTLATTYQRYIIQVRTDKTYFYIGTIDSAGLVATTNFQSPQAQILPKLFLAVGGATPPVANSQILCTGAVVSDTGKNSSQLADGVFPWRRVTVKPASTAVAATDLPLAVGLHPTSPLPAGTAVIGHVIADTGSTTAVTQATASNLNAAVVGTGTAGTPAGNILTVQGVASMTKLLVTPDSVALPANQSVNVSQINAVTPLMGNGITGTGSQRVTIASDNTAFSVNATLTAETTKVIGVTRTADGAGNLLTSNSITYTAKFGLDGNLLGTLGTAFSTAGKVDVKGADGDVFVRQATGSSLNANVTLQTQADTTMVGGVNIKEINAVAPSMGVGATGTGVLRVVQANDAGKTILSKGGSAAASGDNTLVAAGTNKLKVKAFSLTTTSTTAVTCIFQSGAAGTELWRVVLQAISGASTGANLTTTAPDYLFATASATLLNLNLSSAQAVHWSVSYFDEA